jgi:dTDP-4-amino-4,6-dideoxygalactose transaminase
MVDSAGRKNRGFEAQYLQRDPNAWPYYEDDEIAAVVDVLKSGQVNQWTGQWVAQFEETLRNYHKVSYAVATSNGTVALELALRSLGVGPGDEVIVSPRSFSASATMVELVGATSVFADIDPESQNITAQSIEAKISSRTKAVVAVHLAGWPCDMPSICKLGDEHGILIIEDCAQAHGGLIDGLPVGSFGSAAAMSFCQDKIISTGGEGGAVLFKEKRAWKKAISYRDHGKSFEKLNANSLPLLGFRWLVEGPGSNCRMTSMQAAIGNLQYQKLDQWIERRSINAKIWAEAFSDVSGINVPNPPSHLRHAYYRLYAFLVPHNLQPGVGQVHVLQALSHAGLPFNVGACPEIYKEKFYRNRKIGSLPIAKQLGETSLSFDVHHRLDQDDLRLTAQRVARVIRKLTL